MSTCGQRGRCWGEDTKTPSGTDVKGRGTITCPKDCLAQLPILPGPHNRESSMVRVCAGCHPIPQLSMLCPHQTPMPLRLSPSGHTHSHQALQTQELIINRAGVGDPAVGGAGQRQAGSQQSSAWGGFMGCHHGAPADSKHTDTGLVAGGNSEGSANSSQSPP